MNNSTKHYHITQGLEGGYLPDVCYELDCLDALKEI